MLEAGVVDALISVGWSPRAGPADLRDRGRQARGAIGAAGLDGRRQLGQDIASGHAAGLRTIWLTPDSACLPEQATRLTDVAASIVPAFEIIRQICVTVADTGFIVATLVVSRSRVHDRRERKPRADQCGSA